MKTPLRCVIGGREAVNNVNDVAIRVWRVAPNMMCQALEQENAMTPVNLSEANFESTLSQAVGPVLVDFWAEWCGPWRRYGDGSRSWRWPSS